jgi:hypothetical protein
MPPADTRRVVPTPPHALRRSASSRHCACTFYLVFKEPATWWFAPRLSARSRPRSPSALFPSGEPCNLTERSPFRQLFSRCSVDFFEALSRGPHRMQAKFPPCPVALRARGATWECELKEVFRLRADALRRNGSCSVQPIYAARPGLSTQATARIVSSSKPA